MSTKEQNLPIIGFIGQGYVGKNYADDFECRGFSVVRYSLEEPYVSNKGKIAGCDIVFIAVPTPTTPKGFDDSIVEGALSLVGEGKVAVIKSTVIPGTTLNFQKKFSKLTVFFCPEFLSAATAQHDASHPFMNIVGTANQEAETLKKAQAVLDILPKAPYSSICKSEEAELIKYAHNTLGYTKVVFMNLLYDLSVALKVDWKPIRDALASSPMIAPYHLDPVHKTGRGAGGPCLPKDFAAFLQFFAHYSTDEKSLSLLRAIEDKNLALLADSNKDADLVRGIYGDTKKPKR